MTGRQLFAMFEPALNGIAKFLGFLPTHFSRFLYWLTRSIPGALGRGMRYPLVKRLAKSCGKNVSIADNVIILDWAGIEFGDNVQIHPFCYLDGKGGISIGNNVSVAHSSSILSFEHSWEDAEKPIKYNPMDLTAVSIADDVWVGCGVRILAGTVIETRTVLAAGCVTTRKAYTRGIYGGVPAKKLKSI